MAIQNQGDENRVPINQYNFKFLRKSKSGALMESSDEDVGKEVRQAMADKHNKDIEKGELADDESEDDKEWEWDKSESYYSEEDADRDAL